MVIYKVYRSMRGGKKFKGIFLSRESALEYVRLIKKTHSHYTYTIESSNTIPRIKKKDNTNDLLYTYSNSKV